MAASTKPFCPLRWQMVPMVVMTMSVAAMPSECRKAEGLICREAASILAILIPVWIVLK